MRIRKRAPLLPRRAAALAEPGAIFAAIFARCAAWRAPLAGRCFLAVLGRTPSEFGAVVDVVRHLQCSNAVKHVVELERPLRAVGPRIGKFPR